MVDDINTDGIVLAEGLGNLGLGTDLVIAGHQNWLVIPLKFKKPSKEPDAAQDLRAEGRAGLLSNQLRCFVSGINIDASFSIGFLNFPASSGKNPT